MLILFLIIKGIELIKALEWPFSFLATYPCYQCFVQAWQPHVDASAGTSSRAPG
jgi:hypothetical protein